MMAAMSANEPTGSSNDDVAKKLQRAMLVMTVLITVVALALIFVVPWPALLVPILIAVTTPIGYYLSRGDSRS